VGEKQKYLKWVFSLPEELCYNFLPTAGSSLGYKHTEETRAKISVSMTGKTHTPKTLAQMCKSQQLSFRRE